MHLILRLVKVAGIILLLACLVIFFQFNVFALQFVDSLAPGTGWIAFLVLFAMELAAFVALTMAWMPRKSKLVLTENPTEAERAAFQKELVQRLKDNRHVLGAGLRPADPDFANKAMALLDAKADAIIRSDARKVFLGTALAQNGRLDALIVFLVLARMVWRISALYNQRPTPAEIWSVYTTVSSSAFLAFSLDALDIPQTVTESLGSIMPAIAPHMASTSMPFVGTTMHVFTSCVLEGAANGLLAVRAGVLTKNAFCHADLTTSERRALSSREIRQNMLSLSKDCLGDITTGIRDQLKDMAGSVADGAVDKTVTAAKAVASTVSGAASAAGSAADAAVDKTVHAARTVASTVSGAASAAGSAVDKTVHAAKFVASTVSDAATSAGDFVRRGVQGGEAVAAEVAAGVGSTVDRVTSTASRTGTAVTEAVSGAVGAVEGAVHGARDLAQHTLRSAGQTIASGGEAVARTVQSGTDKAKQVVRSAGGLFASVLPAGLAGRRGHTAEEELAMKIALMWTYGPLSSSLAASLAEEFAGTGQTMPAPLADALNRLPDPMLLAPWLESWKGQKKEIRTLMNTLNIRPADEKERVYLDELGALLHVGSTLRGK